MTRFGARPQVPSVRLLGALTSLLAVSVLSPSASSREAKASAAWAVPYGAEFWMCGQRPGNVGAGKFARVDPAVAIDRVTHAFRPAPDGPVVSASTYQAALSPQGMRFHSLLA